ncbi:MAG TPA: low affinity iron permease family protein [Candidatus Eisenbacteria bacterium]|jgi:low affinity Fe/Cu permease|nr:low affinity iron permease family protein [Candidatus Eisenbacteria bacterium]
MSKVHNLFAGIARAAACRAGSAYVFVAAAAVVLAWALTGPFFGWSDTWQLVINTSTTIITFLMVFLIQNSQNRDTQAMQLKLDEIIRAMPKAQNRLLDIENLSEEELEHIHKRYEAIANHEKKSVHHRRRQKSLQPKVVEG